MVFNHLEVEIEELNLKNSIGKLLYDMGYEKYTVAGSELLNDNIKNKVVLD